jgi:hypothetical protein
MDKYEREARVYPAIVGMIIPAILTANFIDAQEIWKSIALGIGWLIPVGLIYSALAYAFRQLAIDTSKMLFQFPLFKKMKQRCPPPNLFFGRATRECQKKR